MEASGDRAADHIAIVLAGGDGTRLRPLTRKITGHEIPKQFCPLLGTRTLLEQTWIRANLVAAPRRTLTVLTRAHEHFYAPILAEAPTDSLIIQPDNRGTAPAILYALLRVAMKSPAATVAMLPSDHYVSDDRKFADQIELAFNATRLRPELTVLLGVAPTGPELGYGWIEPAMAVGEDAPAVFRIRRFWEKPSRETAQNLLGRGCLWNSFVMVARVSTLLGLIMIATPALYAAFAQIRSRLGTPFEARAIRALYAGLEPINFSEQILERTTFNLAVLPMRGVDWSDLGEPHRVMEVLARTGTSPHWAAA
jgi:mannose-1-phosphate guanylyltransferase